MTIFDGGRGADDPGFSWPKALDQHEAQFDGDEYGAAGRLLQREVAAGFAAYDRLAIDGGPVVEMPRRHRGTIRAFLLFLALAALVAGAWHWIPML